LIHFYKRLLRVVAIETYYKIINIKYTKHLFIKLK